MPTLGEIRVNPTTGYHSEPSLTALKDGGYIVAWSDQGTSTTDYIYTQRYNASGVKVGGPALVNTVTNSAQEDPTITALANGGYVVAWQSDTYDDMSDIAAQVYNANGVKVGSEFIVNTTRNGIQDSAEITALKDGGFVVSWASYGQDGSGWGGYLQRYNASGAKVGVETRVSTTTQYDQDGPTVTGLADGGMMVVWEGNGKDDTAGIFGQRFKADGSKSGAEIRINTRIADDQTDPVVKVLSSGNYVVTWQSAPDDGDGDDETDAPGDIYAQLFNAAGVKVGAETRVNTTITGNQEEPNVTAMMNGGYLVTWAGQGIGDANGIFCQLFNASGVKVGTETRINTTTTGNQLFSQVTTLADGGYVVAWESSVVNGQVDVYTQRFDANGNKVSSLTGDALANTLTWTGAGSVIIDGGAGNDTLTGGRANDHLNGGAGNDSLNGAAGADRLTGGDGSDLYYVDNAGDIVSETNATASIGGTDSIYSFLGAYTLGNNVENLRLLSTGAASGTGNSLNNIIDAGVGNNILDGGAGIDTLSYAYATAAVTANLALTTAQATGGSGSDTLLNFENLTGSAYHDKLTGNALANTLTGGAGNDTLTGGAGNDLLIGGAGLDKLYGGTGADKFDFNALSEMGLGAALRDVIGDFKTSEGDKIDLSTLDANVATAANDAFSFIGSSAFSSNAAGQVRFAGGILYGSTDADTAAEFEIQLLGVNTLKVTDLIA
ncbi:calcium-binding protein [Pseudomonas azerbaijanorientalis]|uniref:calcium-binding protein n=1 Tax=Pseudomonas azerbaijanorientalis TaxID=2842350 RepID=UPI001C3E5BF8|nr:calcium-binding protein [Pseudomonas azerbaijanorientalis]QXH62307.1 type I secretion C-terminal target domain-containing protein [Pseudomonas azerbaijanorientalis]